MPVGRVGMAGSHQPLDHRHHLRHVPGAARFDIGGERAVLVLLSDGSDRPALGATLIDQHAPDALRATAGAALEAAQRLSSR